MSFKPINERISVAAQIDVADVERAAREGFVRIVNNRPEGEAPDQPAGAEIEAAARAAGLDYVAIPVSHGGMTLEMVEGMREATAEGRVLAFCRSGTRSTLLWALARSAAGDDPAELADQAAAAGYDVSPVRGAMDQLAQNKAG